MTESKRNTFLEADVEEIRSVFLKTAGFSVLFTILWIPVFLTRCFLVQFVKRYMPSYGKILDHVDSTLEEDFYEINPKNNLVFTLILDSPLELPVLQEIFRRYVLYSKISLSTGQLRYPEFQQYQTDFTGYRFWKNDESFNISNHIREESYSKKFESILKLHQELINETFAVGRSPWEITLVNNYKNDPVKALIVWKSHHTLGDAKSCLKVIVGGLGRKVINFPKTNYQNLSIWDKIHFYGWLPFYFVYCQVVSHFVSRKTDKCHWKWKSETEPLLNVAFSNKFSLDEIKQVGNKHKVTSSAVIMAAVAGGIAKSDTRLSISGIPSQWVLPKADHPEILTNHYYCAGMDLPTDVITPRERLIKCNEIFGDLKASNIPKYDKIICFQHGTWFNPLRTRLLRNGTYPLIVTNIASDGEGFQVGDSPCSELSMTCAPPQGACGNIICIFSYKDTVEVSATLKEGILTKAETQKLVDLIEKEFDILKTI